MLLVTRALGMGGTERQLAVLARGLARRGLSPAVVVFYDRPTPLRDELAAAGVPVISLGKRGRYDVIGFARRAVGFARRLRPEVVYGYLAGPSLVASLMGMAGASTRTVWGVRSTNLGPGDQHWWTRTVDWGQARLARWPDLVICNARSGRDDVIARGFPADRTVVVPNGVDLVRFHPDRGAREASRAQMGVPPEAVVVGIVGRIHPMKDHATFFAAMSRLRARVPALSIWCVGAATDDEHRSVLQLARAESVEDCTVVLPPQDRIERIYPALDLLVSSSSNSEGLSNVLLEARACGIPCVATRVGDAEEVLGPGGDLVPPRDPAALAVICFTALSRSASERNAQAEAARNDVVNRYSDEAMVEATIEHLRVGAPCG
ncbi:MAG TPA: glycosyltransferase [Acidimicrobiales bacterium]|nr:glycosyltransferase [Acidimicrobiales bacterium]